MIVIFVTDPETGSEMTIERNLTEIGMREKALVIDMMRIKIETRWKAKTMKEVFIIPHLKKTEVVRNPRKRKRQRNRRRKIESQILRMKKRRIRKRKRKIRRKGIRN